ncbi:hypothetical protein E8E14_011758 [Neopestalotiopsis sp. 37M]|nr:hypothetical protein E8E14_011758 [Neopestalotiopsis sp. 37M]
MSTDVWSMVGALVAAGTFLPLMFSQPCQRLVTSTIRYTANAFFPSGMRCEKLVWEDVPDGPLQSIDQWLVPHHSRVKRCWTPITESLFTGPPNNRRQRKSMEKPEALGFFGNSYLCIDVKLLVALILCSTKPEKSRSWREGAKSYDDDVHLDIKTIDGNLLVVHFEGKLKKNRVLYTKKEITALMDGYPPWYRDHVVCDHGPVIPFPIHSAADTTRGGWVVAVGLKDSPAEPMALYVVPNTSDRQKDGSYFERTNGTHLRTSVRRVYDCLVMLQKEHMQSRDDLDMVIEAVWYMIKSGPGSGVERKLPSRTVPGGQRVQLNAEQCKFATNLFNKMVWLDADIQALRPILAPVLQAAFSGCYEVIQYLKDTGMRLVLPEGLGDDWSRKVFLRDCIIDEA